MQHMPYGSWPSPLSAEAVAGYAALSEPQIDDDFVWWLQPSAQTTTELWQRAVTLDQPARRVISTTFDLGTRVNSYGGGVYHVNRGAVVFNNLADSRVWVMEPGDEAPRPLTPEDPRLRYADFALSRRRRLVIAVREDHRDATGPSDNVVTTIVAIPLDNPTPHEGTVLCVGADFYAAPQLSVDERLAWCEWDAPAMPWDSTRIVVGNLRSRDSGLPTLVDTFTVAGDSGESALHPRWLSDGDLLYLSDIDGYWNLMRWASDDHGPVAAMDHDFCDAPFLLGGRPYCVVDTDTIACQWFDEGVSRLGLIDLLSGTMEMLPTIGNHVMAMTSSAGRCAIHVGYPDQLPTIVMLDLEDDSWQHVTGHGSVLDPSDVSLPQHVSWSSDGHLTHGWFFPAHLTRVSGPDDQLPPLRVVVHGGPTSQSPASLRLDYQYWTTRGVSVLAVNHGGSTGWGRDYRHRLRGHWGEMDVRDCVTGVEYLVRHGLVDPHRVAIEGDSAGGFTVLRALTTTSTFAAGVSWYGIADLTRFAQETHKFEAHYLDWLIGPWPQSRALYRDRSPLSTARNLRAPILLLQGDCDTVVPLNQAELVADAAAQLGLDHQLIVFSAEGHGFRRAITRREALAAIEQFYARAFGYQPAASRPTGTE